VKRSALGAILVGALLLRLAFLPVLLPGGAGDVKTFAGWTHLLLAYGTHGLYTHVEPFSGHVIDYPPGYALVLAGIAHLYAPLAPADHRRLVLLAFLKLPAILADLGLCVVTFALVRRWRPRRDALIAAAVIAFTPATWMLSAVWGQIDSIPMLVFLFAIALMFARRYTAAWIALGLAVFVKPQAIVAAPLFLVWQIAHEGVRPKLALGPALAFVVAYLGSLPFAPSASPPATFQWLLGCYQAGAALYPYRSVSACNIYTLRGDFYGSDSVPILGVPLWAVAIAVFGALVLVITIGAQRLIAKTDPIGREKLLVTACFIVFTAMFVITTRMHERYLFPAIVLVPFVWYAAPRLRIAAATLTVTFIGNCAFQLFDVLRLTGHGIGFFVILFSALNVVALIVLASRFARGADALPLSRVSSPKATPAGASSTSR
jgi:dolichyl-phosphate-mannose-protein mannosyltransferase